MIAGSGQQQPVRKARENHLKRPSASTLDFEINPGSRSLLLLVQVWRQNGSVEKS